MGELYLYYLTTTSTTMYCGAGDCSPTWIIRNNTQSTGATLIVEPISAADCLNRCAVSSTCVAVDLVIWCTPPQCWMHHSRSNLLRRYRGVNITQYELNTRCATIAPPTSGNNTPLIDSVTVIRPSQPRIGGDVLTSLSFGY